MSVVHLTHKQLETISQLVERHGHARSVCIIDDETGVKLQLSRYRSENVLFLISHYGKALRMS